MKRDFPQGDFEDFLKRSTDSLRMKAPDRVWQNLSKELNKRRRRLVMGIGVLLLVTSTAGYLVITNASGDTSSAASTQQKTTTGANESTSFSTDTEQLPASPSTSDHLAKVVPLPVTASGNSRNRRAQTTKPAIVISMNGRPQTAPESAGQLLSKTTSEISFEPTVVDSYSEFDEQASANRPSATNNEKPTDRNTLPLSIESVVNSFKAQQKTKRFETQLYFTPTISYRKLSENKSYLRSLDPALAVPANYPGLYTSVNHNVTHKPDVGFELGFATKYALSNKVKLRTGVQFNVNRYEIKAFNSTLSPATIALNSGSRMDSLNTYSRYSNVNGYKSNWLRNLSFQLSIPIGAEYVFAGTDKLKIGVAGSVQPTYVLGDRAYMITTDYKNYTQVPWLIRRWNVNTAFETFISYQGAKRVWSIAPQVRYQLLSSFVSQYPVKENLFDFGLKVGVTLNK